MMNTLSPNHLPHAGWDICLARQPIFDPNMHVVAYELLFRSLETNLQSAGDRSDGATRAVLHNVFSEMGLHTVTGGHPAFINCTRNWLMSDALSTLPPDQVVIEILEDLEIDPPLVAAVDRLHQAGYQIALDDFVFTPAWEPLLSKAHIIKYDVMATPVHTLPTLMEALRPYPVQFLAEKIEDYQTFQKCVELGFRYFQGYFLCRPKLLTGKKIPGNRVVLLELLYALQQPAVDVDTLNHIINQDARLGYKLLRMINSPTHGLSRKIATIKEAIVLLGFEKIKQTIQLLLLGMQDNIPHELLVTSLVRAKMMELLAHDMRYPHTDRCFTVGLFSTLDALLDEPMEDLLRHLPLHEEIIQALADKAGIMGNCLNACLHYECGAWSETDSHITGLDLRVLNQAYWTAIPWAIDASGIIQSPPSGKNQAPA